MPADSHAKLCQQSPVDRNALSRVIRQQPEIVLPPRPDCALGTHPLETVLTFSDDADRPGEPTHAAPWVGWWFET